MEILDHRMVRNDICPGGTNRAFILESVGKRAFIAQVADDLGDVGMITAMYDRECLFEVAYSNGITITCDEVGNVQKLVMNVADVYENMPSEVFDRLEPNTALAAKTMIEYKSKLLIDVDLKDGLSLADMSGWVQMLVGDNLRKVSENVGGWEIWPGQGAIVRRIAMNDKQGDLIGLLYVVVGLTGDQLSVGVGDENIALLIKFQRWVDTDMLELARTPKGALNLLGSLIAS